MNFNIPNEDDLIYLHPIVDDDYNVIRFDMYDTKTKVCIGSRSIDDESIKQAGKLVSQATFHKSIYEMCQDIQPFQKCSPEEVIKKCKEQKLTIKIYKQMSELKKIKPTRTFEQLFIEVFADLVGMNYNDNNARLCLMIMYFCFGGNIN